MCTAMHCPLHGQTCNDCLNNNNRDILITASALNSLKQEGKYPSCMTEHLTLLSGASRKDPRQ